MGLGSRLPNACIPFHSVSADELEDLVKQHEQDTSVKTWAVYVARGPKRMVTLQDGLTTKRRFIHAGPVSPYRGFLFLRCGDDIDDEREQALRDEVEILGNHNLAVRYARGSDIDRAVHVVIQE